MVQVKSHIRKTKSGKATQVRNYTRKSKFHRFISRKSALSLPNNSLPFAKNWKIGIFQNKEPLSLTEQKVFNAKFKPYARAYHNADGRMLTINNTAGGYLVSVSDEKGYIKLGNYTVGQIFSSFKQADDFSKKYMIENPKKVYSFEYEKKVKSK